MRRSELQMRGGIGRVVTVDEFTEDQRSIIRTFLAQVRQRAKPGREELQECHQPRGLGDTAWGEYGVSDTDAQTARWWHQRRHKLGSKEWRPAVILGALLKASDWDYIEPERIPVDERALKATPNDRKKARLLFIRKHGVAAFHQKVNPILGNRRCGVKGLFEVPATPETREYLAILVKIASLSQSRADIRGASKALRADDGARETPPPAKL